MPRESVETAVEVAEAISSEIGCQKVTFRKDIAKLSVSGIGLRSHTGVAIGMFKALSDSNLNIQIMNTSEVRVNVVLDGSEGQAGLACLRTAFRDSIR